MSWLKCAVFLSVLCFANSALAEADEQVLGGSALVVIPMFESEDKTAFSGATVGAHVAYQYGVLEDLYTVAQFSFWVVQPSSTAYGHFDTETQRQFDGTLSFNGEGYHGEVGARYKVYAGYDFSPYIEGYVGYLWSTFRDTDLKNEDGVRYGFDIGSFGRGAFTVAGAAGFDLRLWNLMFVGASAKYTMALDDVAKGTLSFPVTMSYYW